MLEKAQTVSKKDGYDANLYFVTKPGPYTLLSGIRAAYHHHMFATGGSFRLLVVDHMKLMALS